MERHCKGARSPSSLLLFLKIILVLFAPLTTDNVRSTVSSWYKPALSHKDFTLKSTSDFGNIVFSAFSRLVMKKKINNINQYMDAAPPPSLFFVFTQKEAAYW